MTSLPLANGATATYRRQGSGAPLVYLHSMLPPADDDAFATALAADFDVIRPVAPGFGDLAEIDDIDDIHDLALYYDDVLRALGLGHEAPIFSREEYGRIAMRGAGDGIGCKQIAAGQVGDRHRLLGIDERLQ